MTTPIHHRWSDIDAEQINGEISRRYLTSTNATVARFELKKGGVVPMHSHHNEQVSCVMSGRLRFRMGGRDIDVGPGEVLQIPGEAPHEVHVLEDAVVFDIFTPSRQDWIDGTDTYFQRR